MDLYRTSLKALHVFTDDKIKQTKRAFNSESLQTNQVTIFRSDLISQLTKNINTHLNVVGGKKIPTTKKRVVHLYFLFWGSKFMLKSKSKNILLNKLSLFSSLHSHHCYNSNYFRIIKDKIRTNNIIYENVVNVLRWHLKKHLNAGIVFLNQHKCRTTNHGPWYSFYISPPIISLITI